MRTSNMERNTRESDAHEGTTWLQSTLTPETLQMEGRLVKCTAGDMASPSTYHLISRPLSVLQLCHIVLLLVFAYLVSLDAVDCVHINSISQAQSFRSGAANSVILDCDFTIQPDDHLVIVKWFLNDEKQHIYQWIQSKDVRTYSPKIKPYVDETFVVKDEKTRHRALRLLNPPASLSGKYTCSVQSLENEDANSTHLVIYEPPVSFDIAVVEVDEENPNEDGFNITCTAIGVFPEPEIKLFKVRANNEDLESTEVETNGTTILSFQSVTDGLYSITLVSHIEQSNQTNQTNQTTSSELVELESPARERLVVAKQNQTRTKKNIAEHYECRLTIPHTEYVEVRRLAIQDGWRSKYRSSGVQSMLSAQFGHRLLLSLTLVLAMRALAIGHHRM